MPVEPGSLGGRDDVSLAGELPELGRWRFTEGLYLEAAEIGGPDDFPTRGVFALVELLDGTDDPEERYVQITEGLDGMVAQFREEKGGLRMMDVTVEVDTAEKAGSEETAPWRYTASLVPADELGPPED